MKQIIISEKEFNNIKDVNDQLSYLQLFYNDINISSTACVISRKIIKDLKPDIININDNYGLIGDNRKPLDPSMGLKDQDIEYISWSNPYEIINLNTCEIISDTSSSDKQSNPQTDHTERVIYINNRVVITGQIIDTISRENNPDLIERLKQGDVVEITDKTEYLYVFKYRAYVNPLLNTSNNPDNLIKISEMTILDDDEDINANLSHYTSNGYIVGRQMDIGVALIECLNSIQSILDKDSYSLNPVINSQFVDLHFDEDSLNFLLNLVTGHELQDEFIFKNPDETLDPNRILVRESADPIREDIHEYNYYNLIRAGYEAEEKTTIDSQNSRYVLIEKKPDHIENNESTCDLEIKIYDDLEDLHRNLQIQDKKQLVNLDDYRNIEKKEEIQKQMQKFNTVTTTLEETSDPYSGFGDPYATISDIDIRGVYKKEAQINNKLSEDLTYEQLKQQLKDITDQDKDIMINNLEILFSSMNHADNLGHIKFIYRPLSIIADNLKNLIAPDEYEELIDKISKYKDYIYINQQEITAADIFNINEKYLRDHEITLKERADLIKTSMTTMTTISDMNLGGSSSEDRQGINEKLHSIRVKVINIKLSLAATESDKVIRKKLRTCLKNCLGDRLGNNRDPFQSSNPFGSRDPFNNVYINMQNIAVPDDVLEVIKDLSYKYRDLEIYDLDYLNGYDTYDYFD